MEIDPIELQYYQTAARRRPAQMWLDSLDTASQEVVVARFARVRRGLFGDAEPVGEGVFELKIDFGPGYRVYFGREGRSVIILLCAGVKKRQSADIVKAQACWRDYLRRRKDEIIH